VQSGPAKSGPADSGPAISGIVTSGPVRRGSDPLSPDPLSSGPVSRAPDSPPRVDLGQPSWPEVIATTLRLWVQRRILRRPDEHAGRRARSRRRAAVVGLVIVVLAAGALAFALASRDVGGAAARSKGSAGAKAGPAALASAAADRQQAAVWVAAQVSHSAVVSCDPAMCAALQASGFPTGDLLTLGASADDPMGSQIVVATTALRSQFGSRLADVYAPVVIASFGTGAAQVNVRVEAPDGGRAYLVAERADLLARQAAGQQMMGNKSLHFARNSWQDVTAGRVDSRLMMLLVALTHQHYQVYVSGFGDSGPGAATGVPLRMVRLSGPPGRHPGGKAYLSAVVRFLRAQRAPFLARTTVLHVSGQTVIQVQFGAPSPLGLLGSNVSP
jgi:hypothetical protein